ncbi:MAG: hypothetical protein ACRCZY_03085 [Phocaeicola sp.]
MVNRMENSLHQIFTEESLSTQFCLGLILSGEPNYGSPDKPWGLRIYFR